jgi:hypothetical protein
VAQVEAGRAYAALAERVASEGVRCTSIEAVGGGGGGGRDWMDGVLQRSRRLDRMRAAIRDVRDGQAAGAVRDLVDSVCLQGRTVGDAMVARGRSAAWRDRAQAMAALCEALDRVHDVA